MLEIHDLALSIKRKGDWAFGLGDADSADSRYDDCYQLTAKALEKNHFMLGCDHTLLLAIYRLNLLAWTDRALLMLSDMMMKELGKRLYHHVLIAKKEIEWIQKQMVGAKEDTESTVVMARFYYILGIAELGLEHPKKALEAFSKAYRMVAEPRSKLGCVTAGAWKELSMKDRQAKIDALLAAAPKNPIDPPEVKEYSMPQVASEHWVMRKLGFKGPIPFSNIIKPGVAIVLTTRPHPSHKRPGPRTAQVGVVKPEMLQKAVDRFREQLNLPIAQGKLMAWVRLEINEIGEESILDDPHWAGSIEESIKKMRDLFG